MREKADLSFENYRLVCPYMQMLPEKIMEHLLMYI